MAVNTAALKTFAPAMRRQLMEAVGRKLDLLLNSQTPDTLSTYAKQIAELRDEQEKSREQLLERVAYTWFNRLCALRYLDAKGWHPFGCKVLMPADSSETQPELLKLMRSGSLPADLKTFTNEQRLNQLLDGQIPTAIPSGDAQGEVYRELVLAACRSYHNLLPDLFEGLDDASELLLPDDLLTEGSIAGSFRSSISDSDCDDVEIIGWLYQFYISEKKDQVIGKTVKAEDIPAATQLFTPNWVVKYMLQNTLGAHWISVYPGSQLKKEMKYYVNPESQSDDTEPLLAAVTPREVNPENLTLIDPACGSGHILVEAYELFKAMYLEKGHQVRDIPALILKNNLYGLDIDERAAQLSSLALLLKARADDRKIFERRACINVHAFTDSRKLDINVLPEVAGHEDSGVSINDLIELKNLFANSNALGSLIQIGVELSGRLNNISQLNSSCKGNLVQVQAVAQLKALALQAKLLSKKYDFVIANPPYMGGRFFCPEVKRFAEGPYPHAKSDMFACFIERGFSLSKDHGYISMVTMESWLFLSSFRVFRENLLQHKTIISLAHLSGGIVCGFGTAAFVFRNFRIPNYIGSYSRTTLADLGSDSIPVEFPVKNEYLVSSGQDSFHGIPGSPIAYWADENVRRIYTNLPQLSAYADIRTGMQTGSNTRFLRLWTEVSASSINTISSANATKRWQMYSKGGGYRKWYGNTEHVVDWLDDGKEIRNFTVDGSLRSRVREISNYFRRAASWSFVGSSFAARYKPPGVFFDVASSCLLENETSVDEILGLLCSKLAGVMLNIQNPTLNYQIEDVSNLPYTPTPSISDLCRELIAISKEDWDSFERSIDFESHPVFANGRPLSSSLKVIFHELGSQSQVTIDRCIELEKSINRTILKSYGIESGVDSEVNECEITLLINPAYRYGSETNDRDLRARFQSDFMAEFLSYATGCMMGRYSPNHPGLILADSRSDQDEQLAAYEAKIGKSISEIQFKPDADAIIPVLDGEWFEDDIVARTREFLKVTFPESSVAENLRFIEDSIGKDIRKYFCKDFYKDHLQTYKKRPIYWMVQSPKAGFACLIYLHRYTPDTLLQVLNNYFRPYLQKLEARQEQLERDQNNDALPKREQTAARKEAEKITKVLKECQAWEQDALLPLAQQRIELDLDDGVKVNYLKLQEVLAKIPGLAAKGD